MNPLPAEFILALARREHKNMSDLAAVWQPRADAGEPGAAEIVREARRLQATFARAIHQHGGAVDAPPTFH